MRSVLRLVLCLFIGLAVRPAHAVEPPPATLLELEARIANLLKKSGVPGASIVLIENGAISWAKDYGVADASANRLVVPETIFRAGSISKTWTSLAIMILVEEGRLSLDAKLSDLLPEVKFDNPWEAADPVRLVHLLEHTTGFDDLAFEKYMLEGADVPLSRAVELYGPYRSRWRPGTRMAYCNAGPVIAGRILEKVTGQTFEEFMSERLFKPMQLQSARWTRTPDIAPLISKSYKAATGSEIKFYELLARPAGTLNITARDLASLPLLMLGRGTYQGRQYLTPQSIARMEQPKTTDAARLGFDAGAGLGVLTDPGKQKTRVYGHNGGIDGFTAAYRYAPDAGAGFVVMANRLTPEFFEISDLLMAYVLRAAPEPVAKSAPISEDQKLAWAGFYGSISPRIQKLTVVEDLMALQGVTVENGAVEINGEAQTHVGGGRFQNMGSAAPSYLIHEMEGQTRLEYIGGVARKLHGWEVAARIAYAVALALAIVASILYALVWIPSAALGRLNDRGGVWVRLLPLLSVLSIAAAFAALAAILTRDDIEELGAPTILGIVVLSATLLIPALPLFAAILLSSRRETIGRWPWLIGWWCTMVTVIAAIYLAVYDAVGFRIWS